MIGIKRNSKRIEKQKFIAKYGTSLLNIDEKEEKTLNPSSINIYLTQVVKNGVSIGYRMFSDNTLLKFECDEYSFYKIKTYKVLKPLSVYLALETLFSKKLISERVNDKNIILLKLTPIDLSFFNHLDSIPFSSNVNSLYEILNGLRKSFIENNKAN